MVMLHFKIWAKGIASNWCLSPPGHTLLLTFCRLWCLSDYMRSQFSTLEGQKSINTHTPHPFYPPIDFFFWQQNDVFLGWWIRKEGIRNYSGAGTDAVKLIARPSWAAFTYCNLWLHTLLCENFDLRFEETGSFCSRKKPIWVLFERCFKRTGSARPPSRGKGRMGRFCLALAEVALVFLGYSRM